MLCNPRQRGRGGRDPAESASGGADVKSSPFLQAKERELELKNTWSENKLSRRQTQAKYGF